MTRFLLFLLNKRGYEPCKSCETLREQLVIANHEKEIMTSTLLDIIRPKISETPAREVEQVTKGPMLWARRREILEQQERIKAERMKTSSVLVKSDKQLEDELKQTTKIVAQNDSIDKLEQELGISSETEEKKENIK